MNSGKPNPVVEVHSEEVQDIISRSPSGLVQVGTLVVFLVFAMFFILSFLIHYPDVVTTNITITTSPSPIVIVSHRAGKLILIKKENEIVESGEIVAYIQSRESVQNILAVDKIAESVSSSSISNKIDSLLFLASSFKLGDVQESVSLLSNHHHDSLMFKEKQQRNKQVIQSKNLIKLYQKLEGNQKSRKELIERELGLNLEKVRTDSTLFTQKAISNLDFNLSKSAYLQQQRLFNDAEIINAELQITALTKRIEEIEASMVADERQLLITQDETLKGLRSQIQEWKSNYLFLAPVKGTLVYFEGLKDDQNVETGKSLFSVVPINRKIFGQAELSSAAFRKVKPGQSVNIRLDDYTLENLDILNGVVKTISRLPSGERYLVTIEFTRNLVGNQEKEIQFCHQKKGQAEIITEDLSLFQRMFSQYHSISLARNKIHKQNFQ